MAITILLISLGLSVLSLLLILLIFKVLKSNFHYKVVREHDSPYSFEAKNQDSKSKQKVVLYGTNEYLMTPNFGSDIPIRLNPLQSNISYLECLQQSAHQPFETRMIKFVGKINDFKDIMLTVQSKDATGQMLQIPFLLRDYIDKDKLDFNDTESEQTAEANIKFKVDGNTQISFNLNPNSSVTMFIFFNTIQYRAMTLFGYLRDLIKGNLPKDNFNRTFISPSIEKM